MRNCNLSRVFSIFIITLLLSLCLNSKIWGDVPPPPVNQLIGIYDSILENPVEADCRYCHDNGLPDRHHLLLDTIIPDPTNAPYGIPGSSYECLSCHAVDSSSGMIIFLVERDCLACHLNIPDSRPSTPHHITQDATDRHCSRCHGSVVQDFDDNHYIPDYDISDITPDPSCKTWDGPICVSGGCDVCHIEDMAALPVIASTMELHHSVRFSCIVCHNAHGNIRDCEACHAPDSLHNIQADSDNPANIGTIIPGQENLGWGHIGNDWDCFGCHESFDGLSASASSSTFSASSFTVSTTPQTEATIPSLAWLSSYSVTSGMDTELIVYGSGFINDTNGMRYTSDVVLESTTESLLLERNSIATDSISVIVPSIIPPGLYDVRVAKYDKLSNKDVLAVIPAVVISEVSCNKKKGVLSIIGSGFGEKPAGTDDYLNVQVDGLNQDIIAWADALIRVSIAECSNKATVTVNALMGSASNAEGGSGGKPPKPCRSKRCG